MKKDKSLLLRLEADRFEDLLHYHVKRRAFLFSFTLTSLILVLCLGVYILYLENRV